MAFGFLLTNKGHKWVCQAIQSPDTHWIIILRSVTHHLKGLWAHESHWWSLYFGSHFQSISCLHISKKNLGFLFSSVSASSLWTKSSVNIKVKLIFSVIITALWIIYGYNNPNPNPGQGCKMFSKNKIKKRERERKKEDGKQAYFSVIYILQLWEIGLMKQQQKN